MNNSDHNDFNAWQNGDENEMNNPNNWFPSHDTAGVAKQSEDMLSLKRTSGSELTDEFCFLNSPYGMTTVTIMRQCRRSPEVFPGV